MSLQDKIASAKPSTFLTDGLSEEEVKQAVDEGRKRTTDTVKGVIFNFDTINRNGSIISSNCKINIPEKVPIVKDFNHCDPPIGFGTVTKSDNSLIFEGNISSTKEETE